MVGNDWRRLTPVRDAEPRDANHVNDVGRDECCIERERMCRYGVIEIHNPRSTAFQGRLDALADCILTSPR